MEPLISPEIYTYIILPVLIFFARVIDMSLETIRVIMITKGYKYIAPTVGFFEIMVWLLAIEQIISNLTNIFCYIAFAAGFSAGTFLGIYLEEKISVGKVLVRIITKSNARKMIKTLKKAGYVLTIMRAEGTTAKKGVRYIFTVINRHQMKNVLRIVRNAEPSAFYTVESVGTTAERDTFGPERKRIAVRLFRTTK